MHYAENISLYWDNDVSWKFIKYVGILCILYIHSNDFLAPACRCFNSLSLSYRNQSIDLFCKAIKNNIFIEHLRTTTFISKITSLPSLLTSSLWCVFVIYFLWMFKDGKKYYNKCINEYTKALIYNDILTLVNFLSADAINKFYWGRF